MARFFTRPKLDYQANSGSLSLLNGGIGLMRDRHDTGEQPPRIDRARVVLAVIGLLGAAAILAVNTQF